MPVQPTQPERVRSEQLEYDEAEIDYGVPDQGGNARVTIPPQFSQPQEQVGYDDDVDPTLPGPPRQSTGQSPLSRSLRSQGYGLGASDMSASMRARAAAASQAGTPTSAGSRTPQYQGSVAGQPGSPRSTTVAAGPGSPSAAATTSRPASPRSTTTAAARPASPSGTAARPGTAQASPQSTLARPQSPRTAGTATPGSARPGTAQASPQSTLARPQSPRTAGPQQPEVYGLQEEVNRRPGATQSSARGPQFDPLARGDALEPPTPRIGSALARPLAVDAAFQGGLQDALLEQEVGAGDASGLRDQDEYGLQGEALREAREQARVMAQRQANAAMAAANWEGRPPTIQEDQAATTIQRIWRGHNTRRRLEEMRRAAAFDATQQFRRGQRVAGPYQDDAQAQHDQDVSMRVTLEIDKLPKYGVLAPAPLRPRFYGVEPIDFDEELNVLYRNRGMQRLLLDQRYGWAENYPLRDWRLFTTRQEKRFVPPVYNPSRRLLDTPRGYRLRVLRVADFPMTVLEGRTFEFQLSMTLYDEATGTFYGNTVYSMYDTYDRAKASQKQAIDLEFSFDVYFHTRISDPRCMAVVEVILAERTLDGAIAGTYSLGWATLPLFRVQQHPAATIDGAPSVSLDQQPGKPLSVPLVAGTPRYLLFRNVYDEDLHPPKVVESCSVVFQADVYPQIESYVALLPENFLVTYSDIIPGLRRFDVQGLLSISTKIVVSSLASPLLSPTYSIQLRRMQFAVPQALDEMLQALPLQDAKTLPQQLINNRAPSVAGSITQPTTHSNVTYYVRATLHNGRTFVGPTIQFQYLRVLEVPGWLVLQSLYADATFDYLMGDVLVALVLELWAQPGKMYIEDPEPTPLLLATTSCIPFSFISDDGSEAAIAVGVHRYKMSSDLNPAMTGSPPPYNWRNIMGDNALRAVPDPMIEFILLETSNHPVPPPFNRDLIILQEHRPPEAMVSQVLDAEGLPPLDEGLEDEELGMAPLPPIVLPPIKPKREFGDPFAPPAELKTPLGRPGMSPPRVARDGSPVLPPLGPGAMGPGHISAEPSAALFELMKSREVERGQLMDITNALARQMQALAEAVGELREERKLMRSSMAALLEPPLDLSAREDQAASTIQRYYDQYRHRKHGASIPTLEELQRFKDMDATQGYGDPLLFAGGQAPQGRTPGGAVAPSRAVMQQLLDAGMIEALPPEVQQLLRRTGPPRAFPTTPIDLNIEARDARTAANIIVQILAYKPHDTLNAPVNLTCVYFTFQFYHFPPTSTEVAFLVSADAELGAAGIQPDEMLQEQNTEAWSKAANVFVLMPGSQSRRGAGVVLKYVLDGSVSPPPPSGVSPSAAAFDSHMAFCHYLAHKGLMIDVWDGDSLLQLGTAGMDLQGLLRQGREFTELLVEVPIMDITTMAPDKLSHQTALSSMQQPGVGDAREAITLSKGSLVVRIINIGLEPINSTTKLSDFDTALIPAKRHKIKIKAAWETNTPLARDLTGLKSLQEFAVLKSQRTRARPIRGGRFSADALDEEEPGIDMDGVKLKILELEQRKSTRVIELDQAMALDGDPLDDNKIVQDDRYRRVQKFLLADVAAARCRRKPAFIRAQLRKRMVVQKVLRVGYGEVVVYEHDFKNPFTQEQVFEIQISNPQELTVMTRLDEFRALKAANVRTYGTPVMPVGDMNPQVMNATRCYLMPSEAITIPFKLQSFEPPPAYKELRSLQPGARVTAPSPQPFAHHQQHQRSESRNTRHTRHSQQGLDTRGGADDPTQSGSHTITVELYPTTGNLNNGFPVQVVELDVVPEPLIIDRTFRFYHPERELLRQTIRIRALPGADLVFPISRLRNLAVAASSADVVVGAGSSGLDGGSERDSVYIKYKCNSAPEMKHFYVLLYLDSLLARPVEVWQVFIHVLRKVDVKAMIGQTSQSSVVIRGGNLSRRVTCYSSHPDELQVSPTSFVLVAGALTEVLLSFRPASVGRQEIKVHLVDAESRELVYALIVATEAQGPVITRTFEIEVPQGAVANKKITYTNPYQQFRTFSLRSNQPWLLHFTPTSLAMPAAATRPVGLTFDARSATAGILDVLVFVNDEDDKNEECFKIRCRIYR